MKKGHPKSTAAINGHPIHPMIVPFPIVFFISAFATDVISVVGDDPGIARASVWLISAGLVGAALAAAAGLIDFAGDARIRALRDAWHHLFANVAVVLIEVVNLLFRLFSADAGVPPFGAILSGAVVLLLLFSGWKGGASWFSGAMSVNSTIIVRRRADRGG